MALITDRDLLLIEPALFNDAMSTATLLSDTADGVLSGTSLTSAAADFATVDIDAGHAVVVGGEIVEVVNRVSATRLTVSLPRASTDDALIEPTPGNAMSVKVPTFARQIDLAEVWVMGGLGIEADDPVLPLDSTAIVNVADVQRLIALETIGRIFRSASAAMPTDQALAERAVLYQTEVTAARDRTHALLDLDGDGVADASRHMSVVILNRI